MLARQIFSNGPLRVAARHSQFSWSSPLPCQSVYQAFNRQLGRNISSRPLTSAATARALNIHGSLAKVRSTNALKFGGAVTVGLGLAALQRPAALCDGPPPGVVESPPPVVPSPNLPPPPQSSLNLYELSFGTVCGVCAGVFVKKGVKTVAFLLGGIFVLLQYFGSLSTIRVNWSRFQSRFENLFYTTDVDGARKPPTVYSLWNWLVGFLTADFPPRASFLAGFVLGLRIG